MALLREVFGSAVEKLKVEAKTWKIEAGSRKARDLRNQSISVLSRAVGFASSVA